MPDDIFDSIDPVFPYYVGLYIRLVFDPKPKCQYTGVEILHNIRLRLQAHHITDRVRMMHLFEIVFRSFPCILYVKLNE